MGGEIKIFRNFRYKITNYSDYSVKWTKKRLYALTSSREVQGAEAYDFWLQCCKMQDVSYVWDDHLMPFSSILVTT